MSAISQRWDQIASDKAQVEKESTSEHLGRNVLQNTARAAETVVGMPGNFKKGFRKSFEDANNFVKSFMPSFPTLEEAEKDYPQAERGGNVEFINDLLFNAPTSGELRENVTPKVAEKISGKKDYLEPKTPTEKKFGDFTQDLTSFFLPGTQQLNTAVRIGAPILGNLVKNGMEYFGASEKTAEQAKLGVMMMTTLMGQSNPSEFASQRIGQAKQMVPDTATIHMGDFAQSIQPLITRLNRGLGVPSKSRTRQGLQDLAGQVDGQGRMNLRSAMDARDHINEWISEAGGWDVPAPTRDASIRNLNTLKRNLITTIDENLARRYPQAGELYRTGYEAAAVTHQSNAISNFIERNFGRKASSVGAKLLFPSLAGGAAVLPKTAAVGAMSYPFYKAGQVAYRVANSPTLAQYYTNVINAAALGNTPVMVTNMEKLDKALKKDEEKQFGKFKSSKDEFHQYIQGKVKQTD